MKAVLSLLFLVILVFATWSGYKKGLIMGIGSLLIFSISVYGANLLSTTYSSEVIDALRPFASGFVEVNIIDKSVRPALGIDVSGLSVEDFLTQNPEKENEFCLQIFSSLGIHDSTCEQLAHETQTYAKEFSTSLQDAAIEVLCLRVTYVAGFILAFLMILILLTVIGNIPNLSFKIPNHDIINDVGGAVAGALQGVCFCLVFAWVLRFFGLLISQEALSQTFLVSWFIDRSLLTGILGI